MTTTILNDKVAMVETCAFPTLGFVVAVCVVVIMIIGVIRGFREQERFIREECGGIWL